MNYKVTILPNKIDFIKSSWLDKSGKVFRYNHKIYRALTSHGLEIAEYIIKSPNIENIYSSGLIETQFADFNIENYQAVIEHKTLDFVSYPQEWSMAMLKDAAIMFCRLNIELMKLGLICKDSHPWNITYHFTTPLFIDFGSIEFINNININSWLKEFELHFYIPLWLAAIGRIDLARYSLQEHPSGFGKKFLSNKLMKYILWQYRYLSKKAEYKFEYFLHSLIKHIENLNIIVAQGEWSNYSQANWKKNILEEILKKYEIYSVIDMAANKGEFAKIVAEKNITVVATDVDEYSIDDLYKKSSIEKLKIIPLVINYLRPTKPFGVGLFYQNSCERLKADMSISLGIMHHLIFKNNVNFQVIENIISNYTKKFILIEFIPKNDNYVSNWLKDKKEKYDWYNRNNFIQVFSQKYQLLQQWKCPHNNREIFLFITKK
ncbi:hypothetical protein STA3757_04580 [Stanieria sp. NIES-3757]|nr:hypothetical protein STA3757_04580 [Stanieria sp. NIES-3757]